MHEGPDGSSAPPGEHVVSKLTAAQVAERCHVSRRGVFYATRVRREAPELCEPMKRGEVTVNDADAVRRRPQGERWSALEAVRRGDVKTMQAFFGQAPRVVRFSAPLAARAEEYMARVGWTKTFQAFAETVFLLAVENLEAEERKAESADLHAREEEG